MGAHSRLRGSLSRRTFRAVGETISIALSALSQTALPRTQSMNRKIILASAAIVASSAMFFFGTGMRPLWWLMWLAPLPVLLVAPRVSGSFAFGIAALSWFAGTLNMWRYLRHILVLPNNPHAGPLVMPMGVAIGVLIVPSCIFGLGVLLSRVFM